MALFSILFFSLSVIFIGIPLIALERNLRKLVFVFPINVLPAIKTCREVVNIFCATANPVEIIIAETDQGRGVLGVIDGNSPKGIENKEA